MKRGKIPVADFWAHKNYVTVELIHLKSNITRVEWQAYLDNRPIALDQNTIRRSDITKRPDRQVGEDVEQAVDEFERRWVVEGFEKLPSVGEGGRKDG
jgi:hypothetical protein